MALYLLLVWGRYLFPGHVKAIMIAEEQLQIPTKKGISDLLLQYQVLVKLPSD